MNEIFDYCAVNATIVDRTKMAIFEDEVNMPLLVSNSSFAVVLLGVVAAAVVVLEPLEPEDGAAVVVGAT